MFKLLGLLIVWFVSLLLHLWSLGVIYFCSTVSDHNHRMILIAAYILTVLFIIGFRRRRTKRLIVSLIGFAGICVWFISIKPNPHAVYPDHLRAPYAEFNGDQVTLYNVRFNRYRTVEDFDVYYETRTYDMNQLKTVDFFVNYWGMDAIAHAFVSFGFSDGRYLPISIEIKPEIGEKYGLLDGFFKQYEILYLWADERDIVLTRTNVRKEDAYLYRVNLKPEAVRRFFMSMLNRTNNLYKKPEFYNTLFESCTNTIGDHVINDNIVEFPFWKRRFLSGDVDQRMYSENLLDTTQPFEVLRKNAKINERAIAAGNVPDFSQKIRTHLQ